MSFAVFVNLFGAGVLTLFVPELTTALQNLNGNGQSSLLGIFVVLNVLSLLLIFFFVPETAGATLGKKDGSLSYISLEELNYIFGVSTLKHISYQLKHMVPWILCRLRWRLAHPFSLIRHIPMIHRRSYDWVHVRTCRRKTDEHHREMSDELEIYNYTE